MTNSTLSVTPAPEPKRNPNKIPEKVMTESPEQSQFSTKPSVNFPVHRHLEEEMQFYNPQ
jgi:hypothetical protein